MRHTAKIILTTLVASLSFLSHSSMANKVTTIAGCEKQAGDNIELSACLDKVNESVDKELTTWINNQTFILQETAQATGRHSALKHFKISQQEFEKFRETNCKWQFLALSPGTGAAAAYKKCYIRLNKARIKELNLISK